MATYLKKVPPKPPQDASNVEQTVRRTLESYLNDLRLLLPTSLGIGTEDPESDDPRPFADRPLKPSLDH